MIAIFLNTNIRTIRKKGTSLRSTIYLMACIDEDIRMTLPAILRDERSRHDQKNHSTTGADTKGRSVCFYYSSMIIAQEHKAQGTTIPLTQFGPGLYLHKG